MDTSAIAALGAYDIEVVHASIGMAIKFGFQGTTYRHAVNCHAPLVLYSWAKELIEQVSTS